jgi:hypothetical protein
VDSVFLYSLAPGALLDVKMPSFWFAGEIGRRDTFCAWTRWHFDENRSNDTLWKEVVVWDVRPVIYSGWCGHADSMVMDGRLDPAEWNGAEVVDASDFFGRAGSPHPAGSAYLYVMNDLSNLYIALDARSESTASENDLWAMLFDDNGTGWWPSFPDSSEGEIRIVNHETVGPWFDFTPHFSNASAKPYYFTFDAWCDTSDSGHMQYECIIPYGADAARGDSIHPNLWAGVGDTFRFSTIAVAAGTNDTFAWWPCSMDSYPNVHKTGQVLLRSGPKPYEDIWVDIISPDPWEWVFIQETYPVAILVANGGDVSETFRAYFRVDNSVDTIYFDSLDVVGLLPHSGRRVRFRDWYVWARKDVYDMCAWAAVADSDTSNTRQCWQVLVTYPPLIVERATAASPSPRTFSLSQNNPNPFTSVTTIACAVARKTVVTIKVFDVAGTEVATPVNNEMEPGFYRLEWNGRGHSGERAPSGTYFVRMQAGEFKAVRKLVIVR